MGGDRGVALTDAGGFDEDEVEARTLCRSDHGVEIFGDDRPRRAGGERPEEHDPRFDGVHPDPVAEERAPAAAARRVDRKDGDLDRVAAVASQPSDQFVAQ